MSKKKVIVYAICKDEAKHVNRWYKSMKEADEIYVLDTGSKDATFKKLQKLGVKVKKKIIDPWRFDVARNESLKMVPNDVDICVCSDLDEVFISGWRKLLEDNWQDDTTRARYTFNWSLDEFDNPIVSFYYEKAHARNGYKWINPVHEILTYDSLEEKFVTIPDLVLNHYPDNSKSRSSYLPLLELSVQEDPNNDRSMHYLGREYMFYERWNDAIDTLIKHLYLESATWKDERSASMRFIARCYIQLNRLNEADMWLDKAIAETPYLRDPYMEKAIFMYSLNEFDSVIELVNKALEIPINQKTYINEVFTFNSTPYDLLSIAYYNKNDQDNAFDNILKAIELSPYDTRLLKNYEIILHMKD